MDCYNQSLEEAFHDHAARSGTDPVSLLNDTDFVVLHTPFRNMPEMAMKKLLSSQLGLDEPQAIAWLEERGFYRGVDPIADIGNGYSASLYLFMAFLLKDRYAKLGDDIVGKKLLIASYGSGNIMTVTTAIVAAGAPAIIERWKLDEMMAASLPASMADYERWAEGTGLGYGERVEASEAASRFRLIGIREDGFREYDHERDGIDQPEESKASVDLSRSVAQVG
jgi:hydroxymethylglutaryl-CoA synthase